MRARASRKRPAGAQTPEQQEGLICAIVEGMARLALFQELHQVLQARSQPQQQQLLQEEGSEGHQQEVCSRQPNTTEVVGGMAITVRYSCSLLFT